MIQRSVEFPPSSYFEGYVRKFLEDGQEIWTLFDCDGIAVCRSYDRSVPFYFAHQHEITVRMLN